MCRRVAGPGSASGASAEKKRVMPKLVDFNKFSVLTSSSSNPWKLPASAAAAEQAAAAGAWRVVALEADCFLPGSPPLH